MKIGIVGQGYVGTAVKTVFEKHYDILTYDVKNTLSNISSLEELVRTVEVIFVCVPTPRSEDGSCDISIVEEAFEWLDTEVLVIKSTVEVGTTERLSDFSIIA